MCSSEVIVKTTKKSLLIAVVIICLTPLSQATDNEIYMASLDWPPYTGEDLPNQGHVIKHAKKVFAAMGYTLKVDFFPWARAVKMGLDPKSKYLGYLPEYFDQSLTEKCAFSDSIGFSPLGFAQRKDNPIEWQNLNDIAQLKSVGVVRGYVNSPGLDARIASGNINADEAVSDAENIKKLSRMRVPIIVIDEQVFEYWLSHDEELMAVKDSVEMHPNLLDKKSLYLCFKKNEEGLAFKDIFNAGLNKQGMKRFMQESFR